MPGDPLQKISPKMPEKVKNTQNWTLLVFVDYFGYFAETLLQTPQKDFFETFGFRRLLYHSPRNVYKLIPLPFFFLFFYANSLRHRFFFVTPMCSSGSRGYCTKTKHEWPGSGSTLKLFFYFYEINSSQDLFLYCKNFGVDGKWLLGSWHIPQLFPGHSPKSLLSLGL